MLPRRQDGPRQPQKLGLPSTFRHRDIVSKPALRSHFSANWATSQTTKPRQIHHSPYRVTLMAPRHSPCLLDVTAPGRSKSARREAGWRFEAAQEQEGLFDDSFALTAPRPRLFSIVQGFGAMVRGTGLKLITCKTDWTYSAYFTISSAI